MARHPGRPPPGRGRARLARRSRSGERSRRVAVATGVLVVWGATLGWHVKREYFRPLEELVVRGASTLPTGPAYYAVTRGGARAGWARTELDTLPGGTGFVLRDFLEVDLGLPGLTGPATLRTEARLGPGLELRSFALESRGALGALRAEGRVGDDDTLRVATVRDAVEDSIRLPLEGPLLLPVVVPLRLAAQPDVEAGDRFRLPVFDPFTLATTRREVEVLQRERRSFPDSAATDEDGRWRAVRRDTVEAWLIEHRIAGLPVRAWMDEDGRLVEMEGGGLRVERTAFELAFFPDRAGRSRGDRDGGEPASRRTAGEPERPDRSAGRRP